MKKSVLAGAVASAAFALAAASAAEADGLAFNQDLAAPGVYYGTGNHNGHFTVLTEDGIELGLRAHVTFDDATAPSTDLYSFDLGDSVSFDWSINPDVGQGAQPTPVDFSSAFLTITDLANHNTQIIPAIFPDANTTTPLAPGAYQNSERLSFHFIDADYNANQNNSFKVTLTLDGVGPNSDTLSVSERIQQGTGAVPEPASWALMALGLAGVVIRRRMSAS